MRRLLLELTALLGVGAVIGFLGPFGSYLEADLLARIARWLVLLMGAYVIGRPLLLLLDRLARALQLPRAAVRAIGIVAASGPVALIWAALGFRDLRPLDNLAGVYIFALLCLLCVVLIAWWAERADASLRSSAEPTPSDGAVADPAIEELSKAQIASTERAPEQPRLMARLGRTFQGPILALESEDHYVRVHGRGGSELVLMRLRDAAAEMDDVAGAQTHRSWWVAKDAIVGFSAAARQATLSNGVTVPIARDTLLRLQRDGFLPAPDADR